MTKHNRERIKELKRELEINKDFEPPTIYFRNYRLEAIFEELEKRSSLE